MEWTRSGRVWLLSTIVAGALALGCGSDDDAAAAAASGAGGGGASACQTCSELVVNNAPPSDACAGTSTTAIQKLVGCLCQPDVCGGAGKGCEAACTMGDKPDGACLACDQTAAAGACKAPWDECMDDVP